MNGRGSVAKYQTKGGLRWRYYFDGPPGPEGRRQQSRGGFLKKADALRALDDHRQQFAGVLDPSEARLGAYVDNWILLRGELGQIRPATVSQYQTSFRMAGDDLRSVPIMKLRAGHLDQRYAELLRTGGRNGAGRSASTVRKLHAVIRKSLADAVRKGSIPTNVADASDPPSSAAAKAAERVVWDAKDGFRFLRWDALQAEQAALVALVMLGGLRRAEIAGLRWSDLTDDELQVARKIAAGPDGTLIEGPPKTAKGHRLVVVPTEAVEALDQYRREQRELVLALGTRSEALLLSRSTGLPMTPDQISGAWRRLVRRAVEAQVIPFAITLHDARHWCGTHLVGAGVDIRTVSEMLGHADPAFTLRTYAHTDDDRKRAAATALGALGAS